MDFKQIIEHTGAQTDNPRPRPSSSSSTRTTNNANKRHIQLDSRVRHYASSVSQAISKTSSSSLVRAFALVVVAVAVLVCTATTLATPTVFPLSPFTRLPHDPTHALGMSMGISVAPLQIVRDISASPRPRLRSYLYMTATSAPASACTSATSVSESGTAPSLGLARQFDLADTSANQTLDEKQQGMLKTLLASNTLQSFPQSNDNDAGRAVQVGRAGLKSGTGLDEAVQVQVQVQAQERLTVEQALQAAMLPSLSVLSLCMGLLFCTGACVFQFL